MGNLHLANLRLPLRSIWQRYALQIDPTLTDVSNLLVPGYGMYFCLSAMSSKQRVGKRPQALICVGASPTYPDCSVIFPPKGITTCPFPVE